MCLSFIFHISLLHLISGLMIDYCKQRLRVVLDWIHLSRGLSDVLQQKYSQGSIITLTKIQAHRSVQTVTDDRKMICRPPLLLLFFLTSLFSVLRLQLQRKTRCVCLRDIALCKPYSRAAQVTCITMCKRKEKKKNKLKVGYMFFGAQQQHQSAKLIKVVCSRTCHRWTAH